MTLVYLLLNSRPSTRLSRSHQLHSHWKPTKLPDACLPKWTWGVWHWDGRHHLRDLHHQHFGYWHFGYWHFGHTWYCNVYELSCGRGWDGNKLRQLLVNCPVFKRLVGPQSCGDPKKCLPQPNTRYLIKVANKAYMLLTGYQNPWFESLWRPEKQSVMNGISTNSREVQK